MLVVFEEVRKSSELDENHTWRRLRCSKGTFVSVRFGFLIFVRDNSRSSLCYNAVLDISRVKSQASP